VATETTHTTRLAQVNVNVNVNVSDIEADVAALKAQGVEFVSETTPCCCEPDSWGGIVAFYDPNGTVVELVEQPFISQLLSLMAWLSELFD
jgi:predicted enzyme related to lactoylglutathione lyase